MLEIKHLNILHIYKYFTLSSKFADFNKCILGKWRIFEDTELFKYKDRYITILAKGVIGESNIVPFENMKNEWSFVEHCGRYMSNQNSFNISGIGTMEVIYIDENIILSKNSSKSFIVFVKDTALSTFQSDNDIITYFSIKENYWLEEAIHLRAKLLNKYDSLLSDSVILWGPALVTTVITALLVIGMQLENSIIAILVEILIWLFLVPVTYISLKVLRKRALIKYRRDNPQNKLVQLLPFKPII